MRFFWSVDFTKTSADGPAFWLSTRSSKLALRSSEDNQGEEIRSLAHCRTLQARPHLNLGSCIHGNSRVSVLLQTFQGTEATTQDGGRTIPSYDGLREASELKQCVEVEGILARQRANQTNLPI